MPIYAYIPKEPNSYIARVLLVLMSLSTTWTSSQWTYWNGRQLGCVGTSPTLCTLLMLCICTYIGIRVKFLRVLITSWPGWQNWGGCWVQKLLDLPKLVHFLLFRTIYFCKGDSLFFHCVYLRSMPLYKRSFGVSFVAVGTGCTRVPSYCCSTFQVNIFIRILWAGIF